MAEPRDDPKSRVHTSIDRDRHKERSGVESPDNRRNNPGVGRENAEDVDPDSAQSDIDRDDSNVD
jgi:hypothetical protein